MSVSITVLVYSFQFSEQNYERLSDKVSAESCSTHKGHPQKFCSNYFLGLEAKVFELIRVYQ